MTGTHCIRFKENVDFLPNWVGDGIFILMYPQNPAISGEQHPRHPKHTLVLPHALHSPPQTFYTLQLPSLTNNLRPVKTGRQYTDINKTSMSTCITLQLSSEISLSTHTGCLCLCLCLCLTLSALYMFCICSVSLPPPLSLCDLVEQGILGKGKTSFSLTQAAAVV